MKRELKAKGWLTMKSLSAKFEDTEKYKTYVSEVKTAEMDASEYLDRFEKTKAEDIEKISKDQEKEKKEQKEMKNQQLEFL